VPTFTIGLHSRSYMGKDHPICLSAVFVRDGRARSARLRVCRAVKRCASQRCVATGTGARRSRDLLSRSTSRSMTSTSRTVTPAAMSVGWRRASVLRRLGAGRPSVVSRRRQALAARPSPRLSKLACADRSIGSGSHHRSRSVEARHPGQPSADILFVIGPGMPRNLRDTMSRSKRSMYGDS